MGVATSFIYRYISNVLNEGLLNEVVTLSISILSGAIVYFISIILMKVDEINIMIEIVKKRILKKY